MTESRRIAARFAELKEKDEGALIAFITAGDPDLKKSKDIILEIDKAGADIIELGIPFSDPMADGPTIQESSERALLAGATLPGVLKLIKEVRKTSEIPIVLFGYYNPIFVYGIERFARDAAKAGADGALVVDLPPEEGRDLKAALDSEGLDHIFTLTPTSNDKRMEIVSKESTGFIYYVSVAGVTGARSSLSKEIKGSVKTVRGFTDLPIGVGFGISTPEQVREICQWSDGVIVGSAIVNIIKRHAKSRELAKKVGRFVASLKKGTR